MGSEHTLHYMFCLHSFLEKNNIPYLFFNYMDLDNSIKKLEIYNEIDWTKSTPINRNLLMSKKYIHDNEGHPNLDGHYYIANEIVKNKGDLNKMFIIEPYNDFKTTYDSVNKAIKLGVPQKNVWIGTTQGTGLGIVNNPTKTPYCLPKHWCSLSEIGKKI
jgi:hypothetical protein